LVPSGGAAALVLESYDVARSRGAVILGEILGYGFSSDGENLSVPSSEGLSRAISMALNNARMQPAETDYINAHATSTPLGDAAEAANILRVFGPKTPPVGALKGMTGHEFWMAGASQVVYAILMAGNGFMAPTVNFEKPDSHTQNLNILTEVRQQAPRRMLCNSAGFGGSNASLVLGFGT
jgi:3-oxoacyl-[acyl-carrier-protein] synthase-1